MSLSREQKLQVNQLRQQYMDIFTKWSQNPTNFEHNISCLRDMRQWFTPYMQLLMPDMEKAQRKMSHGGFFNNLKAAGEMKRSVKIGKKIQDALFNNDEVREHFKQVFAKEPRIIGLTANMSDKHKESIRGNTVISRQDEQAETFAIKFSDGTNITLHSLDDQNSLADAKQFFEEKLKSLEMGQRRAFGMN
jgi:hypothetical protein